MISKMLRMVCIELHLLCENPMLFSLSHASCLAVGSSPPSVVMCRFDFCMPCDFIVFFCPATANDQWRQPADRGKGQVPASISVPCSGRPVLSGGSSQWHSQVFWMCAPGWGKPCAALLLRDAGGTGGDGSSARLSRAEGTRGHLDGIPASRAPAAGLWKPCCPGSQRLGTFSLENAEKPVIS